MYILTFDVEEYHKRTAREEDPQAERSFEEICGKVALEQHIRNVQ